MKKTSLIMLSLAIVLLLPVAVKAYSAKSGASVYVPKTETIEGSLYAVGQNITVEGRVKGDVICAGQAINIKGVVDGDVICAGQTINVDSKIGGNLRIAGSFINIDGSIARNAMAFGATINTAASSTIGSDMLIGAALAEIRGKISRDLYGGGVNIIISGQIDKNIELTLDDRNTTKNKNDKNNTSGLIIDKGAKIGGNLDYSAYKDASIDKGAKITGKISRNALTVPVDKFKPNRAGMFIGIIISIFSALLIGLIIISLWPQAAKDITGKMMEKIGHSIGWGAAFLFLTPVVIIIAAITVIGLPLAGILLAIWLIVLYISKIFVGIAIGRKYFWKDKEDKLVWQMAVGVIISWIIFSIPILGWLLALVAMFWGIGGLWLYYRKA